MSTEPSDSRFPAARRADERILGYLPPRCASWRSCLDCHHVQAAPRLCVYHFEDGRYPEPQDCSRGTDCPHCYFANWDERWTQWEYCEYHAEQLRGEIADTDSDEDE